MHVKQVRKFIRGNWKQDVAMCCALISMNMQSADNYQAVCV